MYNETHTEIWAMYVSVICEPCIQAADSSQEDEMMKVSSAGAGEQEKSEMSASAEGQKTDDENTVIARVVQQVPGLVLYFTQQQTRIKTTIMLFFNILSLQFNTTFLALNKSREACSIEIFINTM